MKLAIVCGGKAQINSENPLRYIGDSVDEVTLILEANGWNSIPFKNATNTEEYSKIIKKYEDINEFLFYYVGHGMGSNISTFEIFFDTNPLTIEQVINASKDKNDNLPKKMALVIDACYSGNAIKDSINIYDVEILTSTDKNTKTYEKIIDDKGTSVFSHYFCKAFKVWQESNFINLENIRDSILGKDDDISDAYYLPNPSGNIGKITIGYTHKINNLKNKIKAHYQKKSDNPQKQIDTFKYEILRYYPRTKEKMYNNIRDSKSLDDLYTVLLKDEKGSYLYCILNSLGIDDEYIDNFKGRKKCKEITTSIDTVIIVIEGDSGNDSKYTANIFHSLDNGVVEHDEYIEEHEWGELYQSKIKSVLEKTLELTCIPKMELQLVLPIKLMKSDFKKEIVNLKKVEGISNDGAWGCKFNVTTKFHSRLKGYESEGDQFFKAWEDNLKKYLNCKESSMESKSYHLYNPNNVSNFCDNDAVCLLSEKSLIDDILLVKLYTFGVPFVLTTQKDVYNFTSHSEYKKWKSSKVKEIKNSSYRFINEMPEELHFICDDGYSDSFLKAFQNVGKNEQENDFLGDEYE